MASKAPPVPKDQQSRKIRGASSPASRDAEVSRDPAGGNAGLNLKQQGRHGGIHQNIVHQGRQQDR
jgi:hypothetical protein